jgi:two-component system LytT family response regulator
MLLFCFFVISAESISENPILSKICTVENKRINAIIVDDEKGCISNLRDHLLKMCPDIYIIATGTSLQEALDQAAGQKVDLAFLDIELFNDNIFNSLPTSETINFKIVFVTAYAQYALKAIKVEALDYLLKPLADDEILECYAKIKRFFFRGITK